MRCKGPNDRVALQKSLRLYEHALTERWRANHERIDDMTKKLFSPDAGLAAL